MSVLISGSMAFDSIMVFKDRFKNHILPDKVHMLNISFLTPEMRREFGGCSGNIAYNLKLLGVDALPLATVGADFGPYFDWFEIKGIDTNCLKVMDNCYTAQAYIITDMDDNQITAFHPGAMDYTHETNIPSDKEFKFGIVSPNGREGMVKHARQFAERKIPFIFDPGQGLPMFNGEELLDFIEKATWVTVNDYEFQMLKERTGKTVEELAAMVDAFIITLGRDGSAIYTGGEKIEIPAAETNIVLDPTGCGDAYRAGLIYGLLNGLSWEKTGRIGSLMGAIKISSHGTQNHSFTIEEFAERFKEFFGEDF
ncbi:MAG: carbohydrate kinase family protein [Gammaproteobacteria bacterium]|nr:MAG: carbohydrate kinase family protein [Gammaproteobacteria bacterium]